jgi:arylsulfatase A-like enzyme
LSDNGPEMGVGSTAGFRGRKRSVFEGGIRIPCFWQLKGKFKPRFDDNFAIATDLFPTFMDAAGIKRSTNLALDGFSLLPFLTDPNNSLIQDPRMGNRRVTWNAMGNQAIFIENTSTTVIFPEKGPNQMYDIKADKYEIKDQKDITPDHKLVHQLKRFTDHGSDSWKNFQAKFDRGRTDRQYDTCDHIPIASSSLNINWSTNHNYTEEKRDVLIPQYTS